MVQTNLKFLHLKPNLVQLPLIMGLLLIYSTANAQSPTVSEEEIETLAVIEVIGQTVKKVPPSISFPLPTLGTSPSRILPTALRPKIHMMPPPIPNPHRILLDPTAKERGSITSVKPLKTERPPFPRRARRLGWQGTVVVRMDIDAQGMVTHAMVQKSSGFSVLDTTALQTTKHWTFSPAKNGEFPIPATVNIPIRFDLIN